VAEYALVAPNDTVIRFSINVDPSVQTKTGYRWLPVATTNPAVNQSTEVREGPVLTVLEDQVTQVWTVRAKTAQELDADKEAALDRFDMLALKALFNHENRIRPLEAKAIVTAAQFRAALKGML
jgi:hypothetical protein